MARHMEPFRTWSEGSLGVALAYLRHLNRTRSELPRGLTLAIEPVTRRGAVAVRDSDGAEVRFITVAKTDKTLLILRP